MAKKIDRTGERFGSYVIIRRVENKHNLVRYECRCDCGKTKIVYEGNLISGKAKSCGCSRRINLVGKRFGRLVVVGNMEIRNGKSYWKCRCDCGNSILVRADQLKRGNTCSCGCLKKEKDIEKGKNLHQKYEETRVNTVVVSTLRRNPVKDTSSQYKGVYYYPRSGEWRASICLIGKSFYLGSYKTEEAAHKARMEAEHILHEPFILKYLERKDGIDTLDSQLEERMKQALEIASR